MRILISLLVVAAAALAQDNPLKPDEAAKAVLEAKDAAALKALAERDNPDPWLVADELCRRGKRDEAEAFAKAAPRVAVKALPAYVASRRGKADDPTRRKRLAAASALLSKKKPREALKALGPPESGPIEDVVGVRLATNRGLALMAVGGLREAYGAHKAAAEAAERLGWLVHAASAYHEQAGVALRGGANAAARAAWERRLAIYQALGDKVGVARTRANFGILHGRQGNYAKALSSFQQALAAQTGLGDKRGAAAMLVNIGWVHAKLGNYAEALAIHKRALAACDALGDEAGVAMALESIGQSHFSLGDTAKALSCLKRALAAQEKLGDNARAATVLGGIGIVYIRLGDYANALSILKRAREEMKALGDKRGAAIASGNIARVHSLQGDYAKALSIYKHALAARKALGDKAGAARMLGGIGIVRQSQGDYATALSIFHEAYAALHALGDKAGAVTMLASIGGAHQKLGDYVKALSIYNKAYAASQAHGDKARAASVLSEIGTVCHAQGDYAKALSIYKQALAAAKGLGDKSGAARTLVNIGTVYRFQGDYAKALSTYEQGHTALDALGDKSGAAKTLVNIGMVHQSLGNYAEALAIYERALAAQMGLGDKAGVVTTLGSIGRSANAQGDYAKAVAFARRAVVQLGTVVGGLGAEAGAGAREPRAFIYDVGARAALVQGDPSELSFFLESGRAGALLEGLKARQTLWAAAVSPKLRAEEAKVRAAEANATKALRAAMRAGNRAEIRARRAEVEAAQEKVSGVIARIQRDAKAGASLIFPQAATLDEIRGTLAAGDALVLYGVFEIEACALVVTKAEARIVSLGKSARIEEAVKALHLDSEKSDPAAALAALSKLVLEPLALPKATTRLLVSPAGALASVPFAALAPTRTISYVPSGTTYRLLREEQGQRGEGVLALGDPDYGTKIDARAITVMRGGFDLVPLPGTRVEANALGTKVLLGAEATEAGLRSAITTKPRWRAVHLACHGYVNQERPALSSLALTPSAEDDGFLTVLEVFRMKIPADLVVLSACETGRGKVLKSEGIVGMTRAFMFAGSPRVIVSLWKVDDEATRALMVKFYELWNPKDGKKGLATATALKQAQEFVAAHDKWKHPYYWAAWQLWGLPD